MIEDKRWGSSKRERRLILVAMCLALGTVVSAVSSLNVALPDLARGLHATQSQLEWIVDSYAVVFAGLLLLAGAVGDRIGRRPVLLAGLAVFAAAAACGLLASSPGGLIAVARGDGRRGGGDHALDAVDHHHGLPCGRARPRRIDLGGRGRRKRPAGPAGLRRSARAVRLGFDLRVQRHSRRVGPGVRRPSRPQFQARPRPPRRGRRRALGARSLRAGLRDHRGA